MSGLVCPRCSTAHAGGERFCTACGMPLVHADRAAAAEPVSEARERARKVKPQLAEGELVQVAGARHLPEAELIQGLLLEEGVPSLLRRTRGFDVPEMLAAGPRDVLVPASGAVVAREVLMKEGMLEPRAAAHGGQDPPGRLLAALVGVAVAGAAFVWLVVDVLGG